MLVKIGRLGDAATERVNFPAGKAIEVVELHRRQWPAQLGQLRHGLLQFAAFVVWADDEHSHVVPGRVRDARPVERVDKVPVEVDVVELAGIDGGTDDAHRAVGAETDEPATAFFLELPGHVEAAAFADGPIQRFGVVDAVQTEQVHVIQPKILHGFFKRGAEFLWVGHRRNFGLDDDFFAGQFGQHIAKLHFRGAVAARGFDVVNAEFEGLMNAGFEIGLVVRRNLVRLDIFPTVLIPHPAARDDRYL